MKVKVVSKHDFSPKMKTGDVVEIDLIRKSNAAGGYSVRVVGVWSKPRWFSVMWFTRYSVEQVMFAANQAILDLLESEGDE